MSRSSLSRLLLAGAGLVLLDAALIEPSRLRVKRVDIPVGPYSDRLAGLKIAHLSDLHVGGPSWRPGTIARAIEACNREEVDLIAITGDVIGGVKGASVAVEMLSKLRSDVPRLAVLGNHDHVHGTKPLDALIRGLQELGIVLLRNESRPLEMRFGRVWFVGVDDGYSMRDDLEGATDGLAREAFPRVLLTHYPDLADRVREGRFQLSLAGHSHGGQVRVPVLTRLINNGHARTRYACGLYQVNGNPLYVSAGVGMSGIPLRFLNWPEVPVLRLVAAPTASPRSRALYMSDKLSIL